MSPPGHRPDGRSADQVRRYGLVVERLDHQFFFSLETVHDHPQLAFTHEITSTKIFPEPAFSPDQERTPNEPEAGRDRATAGLRSLHLVHVGFPGRAISATGSRTAYNAAPPGTTGP